MVSANKKNGDVVNKNPAEVDYSPRRISGDKKRKTLPLGGKLLVFDLEGGGTGFEPAIEEEETHQEQPQPFRPLVWENWHLCKKSSIREGPSL